MGRSTTFRRLGAVRHGQYSPDTVDNYAGYDYDNPHSTGFSATRVGGLPAFGDISMCPRPPLDRSAVGAWEEIARRHRGRRARLLHPGTGVIAGSPPPPASSASFMPRNGWPALFRVRSGASLAGNYAATQIEDNTTITGSATSGGFCSEKNPTCTVILRHEFSQAKFQLVWHLGRATRSYPVHSMNSVTAGYVGFRPAQCSNGPPLSM